MATAKILYIRRIIIAIVMYAYITVYKFEAFIISALTLKHLFKKVLIYVPVLILSFVESS